MTLIRALPEEYSSFASSLQLLDKFEKEKLQEAFVAEELLRKRGDNVSAAAALAGRTLKASLDRSHASSVRFLVIPSRPAVKGSTL